MISPWDTLSRKTLLDTPVFSIHKVRRISRETETEGEFYTLHTRDWVNVVAVTPAEGLVLIRQYRHGTDRVTLEIPGGLVDEGEDPAEAAIRELQEETGYTGAEPILIGTVTPNPAIQTNYCYTYLITDARKTQPPEPEEYEEIAVEIRPISEMPAMIRNGEITHALVVAAFYYFQLQTNFLQE